MNFPHAVRDAVVRDVRPQWMCARARQGEGKKGSQETRAIRERMSRFR